MWEDLYGAGFLIATDMPDVWHLAISRLDEPSYSYLFGYAECVLTLPTVKEKVGATLHVRWLHLPNGILLGNEVVAVVQNATAVVNDLSGRPPLGMVDLLELMKTVSKKGQVQ